jgi:predicted secreted acid phosphatase
MQLKEVPQGISNLSLERKANAEPTSEQVYVFSSSQLQDLVAQAIEKAIVPFEESITDLRGRVNIIAKYQDRQDGRLDRLENIPVKSSEKRKALLEKLDRLLATRRNQAMTFSEIGKLLELGIRSPDGKTTRRQAMTKFSKILLSQGDRYQVFKSKTVGGKMVCLVNDYYLHVLKEMKMV